MLKINIDKISEAEFVRKRESIPVLFSGDMEPRSYYLLNIDDEKKWLIDQVDVGLKTVPYMIHDKFNIILIATTFNLYVIDYLNAKIVFEYELQSPCINFFAKDNIVFIICETEVVHFSLNDKSILKCEDLPYMIEDLSITVDRALIILENGEAIIIK